MYLIVKLGLEFVFFSRVALRSRLRLNTEKMDTRLHRLISNGKRLNNVVFRGN